MADHKELWQELYEAAVVETNPKTLQARVQAAKAAIDARLRELQMDHGGTREEQQALSDAVAGVRVLEREIEGRGSTSQSSTSQSSTSQGSTSQGS
jgi:hypothetical protein